MTQPVRIGMLGSGFIADFYLAGIRLVADAVVVANYSRSAERASALAARHGIARTYDSIEGVCADPDVDLVVIALPNHLHVEAVRAATAHRRAVVCTKPLGRTAAEAAQMVRLVRDAGVMGGYAENSAFAPDVRKMHEIVQSGAIGRVLSIRAREGHSGPHAAHFWDAENAGGGAFLDMGVHGIEEVRILLGKDVPITEVFAWGATLVHGNRTTGDDNATALLRVADGRVMTVEASWTAKGGLEVRTEVSGTGGRIVHDTMSTSMRAFLETPTGYVAEKTDSDTGWVFPVADEARVHGYDAQFRHFVDAYRTGTVPSETFVDGYVVNSVVDAAHRSMKSGRWEAVTLDPDIVHV